VASHIASSLLHTKQYLNNDSITPLFVKEVENISKKMQLVQVKVFSRSGEIIYSTEQKDIDGINNKTYFQEIVAKGGTYTQTVKKSSQSLEGQVMIKDVVETYVPLMSGTMFIGAFEIYYDITKSKEKLGMLTSWSAVIVFAVTLGLFVSIVISGLNIRRSTRACSIAEEELRKHQEQLEQTIEERTHEIENQMLEKKKVELSLHETEAKYRSLVESTDDSIYLVDRDCRYLFINQKHLMRMGLFSSQFLPSIVTTEDRIPLLAAGIAVGVGGGFVEEFGLDRLRHPPAETSLRSSGYGPHRWARVGAVAHASFCSQRQGFAKRSTPPQACRLAVFVPSRLQSSDGLGL